MGVYNSHSLRRKPSSHACKVPAMTLQCGRKTNDVPKNGEYFQTYSYPNIYVYPGNNVSTFGSLFAAYRVFFDFFHSYQPSRNVS